MWRPKNSGGIGLAGAVNLIGPDDDSENDDFDRARNIMEVTRRHTTASPANQELGFIFFLFNMAWPPIEHSIATRFARLDCRFQSMWDNFVRRCIWIRILCGLLCPSRPFHGDVPTPIPLCAPGLRDRRA